MRILVYGMQGSGATLFSYFLCQDPNTIGILDYWGHVSERCPTKAPVPYIPDGGLDLVCKAVVSTTFPWKAHCDSFRPDLTILFRRNVGNYESLDQKWYKNEGGTIDEKFELLKTINEKEFDICMTYEELIADDHGPVLQKLHRLARHKHFSYPRTINEVFKFTMANSEWARKTYEKVWGHGNLQTKDGRPDAQKMARMKGGK